MVTSSSGKIVSSKITSDPINPNVDSRKFNRISLVETGSSVAIIGGKVDALGNKAYIKTRNKNVSNAIPISYTNNTTNGVFTTSSEMTGYNVWNVSLNNSMSWRSETIVDSYIEYTFNNLINITGYSLQGDMNNTLSSPIAWILSAYDEDTEEWIQLDSQTNQPLGYGFVYEYHIVNEVFYHKYRITFSANAGYASYIGVSKFQLFTGDTSINSNEIKVDVSEDSPIYFYKNLGIRYDNKTDSIIYKYTTPVTITNTFLNKTTMLYAMFDDLSKAFKLYYDELYTILSTYSQTDIQTKLIPIASFTTDTLGNVIDARYTTTIRDPDDTYFYEYKSGTPAPARYGSFTALPYINSISRMGGYYYPSDYKGYNLIFDTLHDSWTTKLNLTVPRIAMTTGLINDNIITVSGGTSIDVSSTAVISFNIISNTWTNKQGLSPGALLGSGDDDKSDQIYICGGNTAGTKTSIALNRKYNFTNNTWVNLLNVTDALYAHQYVNYNGNMYKIAGLILTAPSNETSMYNCVENSWTIKANKPTKTSYLSADVYNNKIVTAYRKEVQIYTPSENTWTINPDSRIGLSDYHYGQVIGNLFFMFNEQYPTTAYPLQDNANYTTSPWVTKSAPPLSIGAFGGAKYLNDIYTIQGMNLSFNYKYSTNLDCWTINPSIGFVTAYTGTSKLATVNSSIYAASNYICCTLIYKIFEQTYVYKYCPYTTVFTSDVYWNNQIYYNVSSGLSAYNIITESHEIKLTGLNISSNQCTTTVGIADSEYIFNLYNVYNVSHFTNTFITKTTPTKITNTYISSELDNMDIYYSQCTTPFFKYNILTDTHVTDVPKPYARYGYLAKIGSAIYDVGDTKVNTYSCK